MCSYARFVYSECPWHLTLEWPGSPGVRASSFVLSASNQGPRGAICPIVGDLRAPQSFGTQDQTTSTRSTLPHPYHHNSSLHLILFQRYLFELFIYPIIGRPGHRTSCFQGWQSPLPYLGCGGLRWPTRPAHLTLLSVRLHEYS